MEKSNNKYTLALSTCLILSALPNNASSQSLGEVGAYDKMPTVIEAERCARNFTCKSKLRELIRKVVREMNKQLKNKKGSFADLRVSVQISHPYNMHGKADYTKAIFSSAPYNGTPGHAPQIRICQAVNDKNCSATPINDKVLEHSMRTLDYYLKNVCLKSNAKTLKIRAAEMKKAKAEIDKLKKESESWVEYFKDPEVWKETIYYALDKHAKPAPISAVSMVINQNRKDKDGSVIISCYAEQDVPVNYYSDGTFGKVSSIPKGWNAFKFTVPLKNIMTK